MTALRLEVVADPSWKLDVYEITAAGRTATTAASTPVRVLLGDGDVGKPIAVEVSGLRNGQRRARGKTEVTPVLHQTVPASLTLTLLPCGAWCTPGVTRCQGAGTVECRRSDSLCNEWSDITPCPAAQPACSFGTCGETCVDECVVGEIRCDGPRARTLCGQADADQCLEWLPEIPCGEGETCSGGRCGPACKDECEPGEVRCQGAGVTRCGDGDLDGCREWGPEMRCADGKACSDGSCQASCTDDCTVDLCEGQTFRRCGQFDADPCLDLSSGTPCGSADPCVQASCSATAGCQTEPVACKTPPPSSCVGPDTLRTWDMVGVCAMGTCSYMAHDVACPRCPDCDPCAGVVCDKPPSSCFAPTGSCKAGACSYAPMDGGACSDGKGCTVGDTCKAGACGGTAKACTTPPPPACTSSTVLRTYGASGTCTEPAGTCTYTPVDTTCASGCSAGACAGDPCAGVTCTTPPSPAACYVAAGMCVGGVCSYGFANGATCSDGDACTDLDTCDDGTCAGTPRVCDEPPPAECTSMTDLRTWGAMGSCTGGACSYPPSDSTCAHGCSAGACNPDPCAGVTCTSPPAPTCVSGTTRRTYASPGTCADGDCTYEPTDTVCPIACSGGACTGTCTPGPWAMATIQSTGVVGTYASLALDGADGVHVVSGYTGMGFLYAHKPAGGSWSAAPVGPTTDIARWTSVKVDGSGGVHVSYYDYGVGVLRYAYKPSGGSFTTVTVDSTANVGQYSSLALDGSGGVHIAYQDVSNWDLKVASKPSGGGWSTVGVDTGSVKVGQFASLAIDGADALHVSYYDFDAEDLKYARKPSGGSWAKTVVDSAGNVGWDTAIAAEAGGVAHVSYYDFDGAQLKYARRSTDGAWTKVVVDSGGANDVGQYTSIVVDGSGGLGIGYHDYSAGQLKYAFKPSGGSWSTTVLDYGAGGTLEVGRFTAIGRDSAGRTHIGYADWTNDDLEYIVQNCL